MSRPSIKAVDAYCKLINWDNAMPNAFPEEVEPLDAKSRPRPDAVPQSHGANHPGRIPAGPLGAAAKEIEAKTGRNPIVEGIKKFFPGVRMGYVTEDGFRQCCDNCQQPLPAGPALHDELWTSIAQPDAFLCFDCIEKRLGRPLTQADLKTCAFNAGWISFDGADVAAMQFARGRRLLPP